VLPGAVFGEMNVLELDVKYHSTTRALTNLDVYRVSSEEVKAIRLIFNLRSTCADSCCCFWFKQLPLLTAQHDVLLAFSFSPQIIRAMKPTLLRNIRLLLVRSRVLRIKLATYRLVAINSLEAKASLKKVVKALPPDPTKIVKTAKIGLGSVDAVDATFDAGSLSPFTPLARQSSSPLPEKVNQLFFPSGSTAGAKSSPNNLIHGAAAAAGSGSSAAGVGGAGGDGGRGGEDSGSGPSELVALRAEFAAERAESSKRHASLLALVQQQQGLLSALLAQHQQQHPQAQEGPPDAAQPSR
jgi:hypothetical protein